MPRVSEAKKQHAGGRAEAAGPFEVWAARAWNVFNEGRPFSIVYPLLVLLAAAPLGLAPDGSLGLALLGAGASALVLSRFSYALRGRALLWLAALAALPLLEPWRAPALLAGALAGYVFFTVVVWGSVYYHLRTGAPWTNGLRFWRLVLTNSDPTSGNALEQLPKLLIALSAGTLLAEDPGSGSLVQVTAAVGIAAALGVVAARSFARRLPRYPERAPRRPAGEALARRVYVIVVDGCNRGRLWQAHAPVMDRLAREGTEYLAVEPAYPARTVVCFSSMLTGATPAEHGMRSNFAPRLGVRCESVFDDAGEPGPARKARGDRAPARPLRRGGGALGDLGAADLADRRLARGRGPAGSGGGGSPTCWCSSSWPPTSSATCAACATPSTSISSPRPTARSATSSPSSRSAASSTAPR